MRIHSLDYIEYGGQSYAWTVEELTLIDINLVVGKNATGKSRILRIINGLARLIEGTIQPAGLASGYYKAVLKDYQVTRSDAKQNKPDLVYTLDINEGKVQREILEVGGVTKLDRKNEGRGSIYFEKNGQTIDIQIPVGTTAAAARRDSEQHGFFEELHQWAHSVRYYESARTEQNTFSAFEGNFTLEAVGNAPLQNQLHLIVKIGKNKYSYDFLKAVIRDMHRVGYDISDFGLVPAKGMSVPVPTAGVLQTLYVLESGIEKRLLQGEISDGMMRALSTLIFIHFLRLQKKPGCFLIDDIGEGLDFDRSTRLIATIIELAEKNHLQLVMTTNDRFVMNGVPLQYWSVVEREKGTVKVFNNRNHPERFSEFEEFGFHNFDFFAKQFFSSGVQTKKP